MATGRIGVTPTLRTRWSKQPSAGTTSLSGLDDNSVSLVYDVGYEAVYRNGVLLSRTNDYTATTGNSITLIDATIAGDIIEVFANQLLPLTNAIGNGQYTAKGALLSATAASTPAVLTVGSNDQVLTADSSTSTGLKWATPASGGMTLINAGGTTLTGASVSITSIPTTYVNLLVIVRNFKPASDGQELNLQFNSDTGTNYSSVVANGTSLTVNTIWMRITDAADDTVANGLAATTIYDYANTATVRIADGIYWGNSDGVTTTFNYRQYAGIYKSTGTAITSIQFKPSSGNFTSGTVFVYGVK